MSNYNEFGIIRGLDIEEYHLHEATSNSKLSIIRDEGAHFYKRAIIDKEPDLRKVTKAMKTGKAFDCFLLDGPEVFAKKYVCPPTEYPGGKKGDEMKPWHNGAVYCKEWTQEQEDKGITVISDPPEVYEAMKKSIDNHPVAAALMRQGEPQVSLRIKSELWPHIPGIQCRPDWFSMEPLILTAEEKRTLPPRFVKALSGELPYTIDLKTDADFSKVFDPFDPLSPQNGKPIYNFGYYRQAAIDQHVAVRAGVGPMQVFFLFIEKTEPYRCGVVLLSDNYLDVGMKQVERDVAFLNDCYRTGSWPNSPIDLIELDVPIWLEYKAAREYDAAPIHDIYQRD